MGRQRKPRPLPAHLARARARVDGWRKRKARSKERRMPEPLWESAVRLAEAHGIHAVSRALGLNYDNLKRRVAGGGKPTRSSSPAFVELEVGRPASHPECVIEFEDRAGAKLTVRLSGQRDVDLVGLTGAFFAKRRR